MNQDADICLHRSVVSSQIRDVFQLQISDVDIIRDESR